MPATSAALMIPLFGVTWGALFLGEPVTVVLSEKGWVRCAKGHDVDAAALSYKAGDGFKAAASGRSRSHRSSSTAA